MPLAARASTQAAIASRMFAMASSSVRPWDTQPGMAGHSATIMPVSSRSNVTTSLIGRSSPAHYPTAPRGAGGGLTCRIRIPALGESGPFQQPYTFRVPTRWNFDVSLFKNFALGGSRRLQLRFGVFNLFNQAAPTLDDIDLDLRTECNVRVDGVPDGAGGEAYGVCDPNLGYYFTDLARDSFGTIKTKHGHRVIELAVRFDF